MNLFQYQQVSLLLIIVFAMVLVAERFSAWCRDRLA
jgi:ABC-type phosphate/phosphonate transport system permease subunit